MNENSQFVIVPKPLYDSQFPNSKIMGNKIVSYIDETENPKRKRKNPQGKKRKI